MKIAFFTNTYLPHVGGVARSVSIFARSYRELGHPCLVFAPEFKEHSKDEIDVVRVPAITNFNQSGFSVNLPVPGLIADALDKFEPDIVHSHHPFLLGDAAMRAAYARNLPLVFTHHTLYEHYTGYVSLDNEYIQRAIASLATRYANACNLVFAPSGSVANLIIRRGVRTKVVTQPTGIDVEKFASGDGERFRRRYGIPPEAFLVGHVGRLGREKNLDYLVRACCKAAGEGETMHVAIVGDGQYRTGVERLIRDKGAQDQFCLTGSLAGSELYDAYAAFDLFVFSSRSETQGLVLAEAMASATPVLALDASGVRDIVENGDNGVLLPEDTPLEKFAETMVALIEDSHRLSRLGEGAAETARSLSQERMAEQALEHYRNLLSGAFKRKALPVKGEFENLSRTLGRLEAELELIRLKVKAATSAMGRDHPSEEMEEPK